ncbi:protein kinase [Scytonema hofmannii PCC 7110]|uniref:non-specific serine/threonine protein kinase n=1 Tax=Scytonema hofmannii PCC 7110 TaxID=128403 RepID=A0A139XE08_9CYAN|nr:serine/threonine-protein kinase [Scytonema hofmannii]KYC42842.1 protein kinase [Scytonema hofmannii PCC 7110]
MLLNNRYRVLRTLGNGGFGETFLAEDTQMPSQRRCVIKQLKPIQDNPQVYELVQQRFRREAAILEDLGDGSSQIPRLYAYFSENGQFYLVQEYIEGQTLTAKVQQQGLLSESSVKEILTSILPVLEFVHNKGIVHRDIKPENILIRHRDEQPVLIDFGAVKETVGTVMTPSGNSTKSIVIGTPGYMPSEQSVGRPMFASDLYSLGLTAIYLLTGKSPQELGTDPATGAVLWRQYALSVTPSFAAVLEKAIQFSTHDRFTTAREMLQALQTGTVPVAPTVPYIHPQVPTTPPNPTPQHTLPISPAQSSQPSSQSSRPSNWFDGTFIGSLLAAIGVTVAIGTGIFVIFNWKQSQQQVQQSSTQQTQTSIQPSAEPSEEPQETIPSQETQVPETTPSPQVSDSSSPSVDQPSPEQAIQNYYSTINRGEYQTGWNQLSPTYQNNQRLHPNGYLSYIDWWGGQVQRVELEQVSLVEAGTETATVNAQLRYFMKTGKVVPSSVRFFLLWDAQNSKWIIADAR